MKIDVHIPTLTETKDAIVIRIPKEWVRAPHAHPLTEAEVLRIVSRGEREFRRGKTQALGTFLRRYRLGHATTVRRSR